MSTFNGLVPEFPDIRIDFFRHHPGVQPPLACFLSHIHSDHLAGLDSLRSPFVYCSAATREILLHLERYPCRINYAKGILEARQLTYKHLGKVLKPLPLETPIKLELQLGHYIQATLFDANHCPGAVMFLIEGDGKAILYTGDVRCEPWFVNTLTRNPILIEYTSGLKTLDRLYLDTSFIEDFPFQTKAEGIAELLRKVSRYPQDTVFHIQAWTFGYEDVWVALSKALNSPIHVDEYKLRVYNSLRSRSSDRRQGADSYMTTSAPALTGFMCGNTPQPGCLTSNQTVRLHSCERGNMCEAAKQASVVRIQPIVAHLAAGDAIREAGVGGGGEDLECGVDLNLLPPQDLHALLDMICSSSSVDEEVRKRCETVMTQTDTGDLASLVNLDMAILGEDLSTDLQKALLAIARNIVPNKHSVEKLGDTPKPHLPTVIQFPYARHSSYAELCLLVDTFKPRDIWPCTVNPKYWKHNAISIESLFGQHCSDNLFAHDEMMRLSGEVPGDVYEPENDSQHVDSSTPKPFSSPTVGPTYIGCTSSPKLHSGTMDHHAADRFPDQGLENLLKDSPPTKAHTHTPAIGGVGQQSQMQQSEGGIVPSQKRHFHECEGNEEDEEAGDSQRSESSFTSKLSFRHSSTRQDAYFQMLANVAGGEWNPISLISTGDNHTFKEREL